MIKIKSIRLGVNIDHCATLRQVRGGTTAYPNLIECAEWAKKGGADLITIHLREDRRHIQDQDLFDLVKWGKLPINLELAPNLKMLPIALKARPQWICFVPEKRKELTTEGGLDLRKIFPKMQNKILPNIFKKNIKVSFFIAPDINQVKLAAQLGVQAVEFHTGHWVLLAGRKKQKEWNALVQASLLAHDLGLKVHAGHGLNYDNIEKIKTLPFLEELNIGHSLVCYGLDQGLTQAVKKMKKLMKK